MHLFFTYIQQKLQNRNDAKTKIGIEKKSRVCVSLDARQQAIRTASPVTIYEEQTSWLTGLPARER